MIIMSVGNNLAVGFGIIGAVAIIRFRTLVSDPRNIIFMFAGISVGITTGVYGYAVSVSGTLLFCLAAIMLRFSRYAKSENTLFEVFISHSDPIEFSLQEYLAHRFEINITSQRKLSDGSFKNEYLLSAKTKVSEIEIFKQLSLIADLKELKVVRKKINAQL
jgi:Ca2+/Na+ antiporter